MKSRVDWTIHAQMLVEEQVGQVVEVNAHIHGSLDADSTQAIDNAVLLEFQFLDMGITGSTYQPYHERYQPR